MIDPIPARAAILSGSNLFDPAWYRRMHRDVGLLGMDAAQHYLRYGHEMGRMSRHDTRLNDAAIAALDVPPPKRGQVIRTANDIALGGQDVLAIAFAELHLPDEFLHTADALRANAALKSGDRDGWLRHLNIYLAHYRSPEVVLQDGAVLLERLGAAPLAPVTDGPLVTVIMPAWNAERTVRAAARSILNQSWRQLELIIVDDASDDTTPQVLQEIAAADPRVTVLRNRVNVGPYVSKNIALMQAKGDWVTGHDADDWSFPNRLHDHISKARAAGAPASYSYMLRMLDTGELNQFSNVGAFSRDGVARVASISTLFAADFLRERLGAW
ncbi:MAG: glycosyltransferase family 2 protein, partial [Rubellimicrobium sp.]|nr:glycosyltransferase family 2 protein [Rubellimicrobium sp.]